MKPAPKTLYKYLDSGGAEAFLKQPQIRFKDWRELDDSMEVLPGFRPLTESEIPQMGAAMFEENAGKVSLSHCLAFYRAFSELDPLYLERQAREILKEQDCTLFVCSLSARSDSGAMWAHYGENHKGILFGIGHVLKRISEENSSQLKNITYSSSRPQIAFPVRNDTAMIEAIHTKCEDWRYQEEWRLISGSKKTILLLPSEVAEVIVGFEASPEIVTLALALKEHGVVVSKAYPDPTFHKVSFERV